MAIILPIHGEMSGRIGGNVWSRNKGGQYVRQGTTPTNPQSSRQMATRTILGALASAWTSTLTQVQRDGWDVYASTHPVKNALGVDVNITGLAWYVRANARLVDAGESAVATAPITVAPAALLTLAVDISGAAVADVTFTAAVPALHFLQLWVSLPVTAGSSPNRFQCRLAGYSAAAEPSPWAAALPHTFQSGERGVFYAAVMSPAGLVSAYLQAIDDSDY